MKKIINITVILSIILVSLSAFAITPVRKTYNSGDIQGKYISTDGALFFTFVKDSLYVDVASSGCGLTCYKLVKKPSYNKNVILFDGYENDYVDGISRKVLITVKKINTYRYKIVNNYKGSKEECNIEKVLK